MFGNDGGRREGVRYEGDVCGVGARRLLPQGWRKRGNVEGGMKEDGGGRGGGVGAGLLGL